MTSTMKPRSEDYVNCPYCAARLVSRPVDGRPRPSCPSCGFVQFRDPKVSVVALLTDPPGQRVLLVQRRFGHRKGRWALPGGFVEADEMPEVALERELVEETGLAVKVGDPLAVFPMRDSGGARIGFVMAYRVELRPDTAAHPRAGDDASRVAWFSRGHPLPPLAFASTRRLLTTWEQEP
jgi:8-oxo-dGTP diphosphatase